MVRHYIFQMNDEISKHFVVKFEYSFLKIEYKIEKNSIEMVIYNQHCHYMFSKLRFFENIEPKHCLFNTK